MTELIDLKIYVFYASLNGICFFLFRKYKMYCLEKFYIFHKNFYFSKDVQYQ